MCWPILTIPPKPLFTLGNNKATHWRQRQNAPLAKETLNRVLKIVTHLDYSSLNSGAQLEYSNSNTSCAD
eukprot:1892131-Prymnesium_polylepis.1